MHGSPTKTKSKRLWMKRLIVGGAIIGFLVLVGSALGFYFWLQTYLQGESFRKLVGEKTSSFIQAEGEYTPFRWDGSSLYSGGFSAKGKKEALITNLHADEIRADLNWRGLFDHVWQIDRLEVQHLRLSLKQSSSSSKANTVIIENSTLSKPTPPSSESSKNESYLPRKMDLRKMVIHQTNVEWKDQKDKTNEIQDVQLVITPEGRGWNVVGTGGRFLQIDWPLSEIDYFKLRYQEPQIFITESRLKLQEKGVLKVSGEMSVEKNSQMDLFAELNDLRITSLLPEDWRAKLHGNLSGNAKINGPLNQLPKAIKIKGAVYLTNGQLEALPVLDQIALFTQMRQFRQLVLQKASADFSWENSKLIVNHLAVESEGLIRIEGDFTIENEMIDGQFQVGVTPSSLRWLPGAQSRVFTVEHDGYAWTPMRLTGPAKHPKEDLSQRLILAASVAGSEVVEGAEKTIEKGVQGVFDLIKPVLP